MVAVKFRLHGTSEETLGYLGYKRCYVTSVTRDVRLPWLQEMLGYLGYKQQSSFQSLYPLLFAPQVLLQERARHDTYITNPW